ncbi:hypothetical protein QBC41DRAFT_303384 [Cercophora samala]|uniref:Uncharacterized protein n=1 Tax=Cercophora samala TaxID=330535 RepID=A0AA40D9T3_9PEZI|nr:hypothetical protein QBC41DRAFT_303384 [Cercophora samala]
MFHARRRSGACPMAEWEAQQSLAAGGDVPCENEPSLPAGSSAGDDPRAGAPSVPGSWPAPPGSRLDAAEDEDPLLGSEGESVRYSGSEDGCEWDSDDFDTTLFPDSPSAGGGYVDVDVDDDDDDGDDWADDMDDDDFPEESATFNNDDNDFGVEAYSEDDRDKDFGVVGYDDESESSEMCFWEENTLEEECEEAYEEGLNDGRIRGYVHGYEDGFVAQLPSQYRSPFDEVDDDKEGLAGCDEEYDDPEARAIWESYTKGLMETYEGARRKGYVDGVEAYKKHRKRSAGTRKGTGYLGLVLRSVWHDVVAPGFGVARWAFGQLRALWKTVTVLVWGKNKGNDDWVNVSK